MTHGQTGFASMFEGLTVDKKIALAKEKMQKVLDHFLYVIELHANNAFVVYSDTLVSQIPTSFAANAFNVFQRSMHQIEIVRLCALWDSIKPNKENIPTVVALIDDQDVIAALADEVRGHHANQGGHILNPSDDPELVKLEQEAVLNSQKQFGDEQAARATADLFEAIKDAKIIKASDRLASVMNLRDKHLAHSLTASYREKDGPIPPMNFGDETELLKASIPIVERLYCWVAGASFSIAVSEEIDQKNAEALWKGCTFKVLR
jgi:hypothetical protein